MSREERLYFQVFSGALIGIALGVLAFVMVSTCALCSTASAAEPLAVKTQISRSNINSSSRIPQKDSSDLHAIVVERLPLPVEATNRHVTDAAAIGRAVLPGDHSFGAIPDSMPMQVDGMMVNHLLDETAEITEENGESVPYEWSTRDWMIVTGSHQSFNGAELDADAFESAGYDIVVFFSKSEFRTAIVGYDSAEAASIDLVTIRATLRQSAQLAALNQFCPQIINHTEFHECLN